MLGVDPRAQTGTGKTTNPRQNARTTLVHPNPPLGDPVNDGR